MSFILDALKKSESDRQRQSGPSLFEVKVAPPRRTLPLWAVAIAVLLGINVVVVSWMLLRRNPTGGQQRPADSVATAVPAAPAAAPVVVRTPVETEAPATAPRAANAAPAAGKADTQPSAHPVPPAASPAAIAGGAEQHSPTAATTATQDGSGQTGGAPPAGGNASDYAPAVESAAASGAAAQGNAEGLPLYQQIVSSAGLPALHLDLHVFAANPKDRFVMINMHRLGEGESLPSGVRVEAIRPDGAVLSYQGTRFLLPRD
jgi:general secretion pathway protein B